MQTTYFASFLLGERQNSAPTDLGAVLKSIEAWLFQNKHRPLSKPDGWPFAGPEMVDLGNQVSVRAIRLEANGRDEAIAIRYQHPDSKQSSSRVWRTDCVLSMREPDNIRFSITVAAGVTGDGISPVWTPSTRPRIVKELIDLFGARERQFPLKSTFINVADGEAERFSQFLSDPQRMLPVVFISRSNKDNALHIDPEEMAAKLAGLAYVCAATSNALSRNLVQFIDNELNAYDGAVRLYWPRLSPDDPIYRHPLWTRFRLAAKRDSNRLLSDDLLQRIASASITRTISDTVRWEDVERKSAAHSISKIRDSSDARISSIDLDRWLSDYEQELANHDETRRQLEQTADALRNADAAVERWKQMYLTALQKRTDAPDDEELVIEDVHAAIEEAKARFSKEIFFYDNRIRKEANEFEEPALVFAALHWLSTVYRAARLSGGGGDHVTLNHSCREFCQFSYHAHQSEVTMGMFPEDYELQHDGKTVKLKEHMAFGKSTEPRRTIRIAFFFDAKLKKVIIGYVGQHQTSRKSN